MIDRKGRTLTPKQEEQMEAFGSKLSHEVAGRATTSRRDRARIAKRYAQVRRKLAEWRSGASR